MTVFTGATPDECWPLVRDWHYSGRMPGNIQHCYAIRQPGGLFGDTGTLMAAAIYSIPPTRWAEPVLELSRLVRTNRSEINLTQLLSFCNKWLRISGHQLVVSFADWTHAHHGGIYQAASWHFGGKRDSRMDGLLIDGVFKPGRSCNSLYGTRSPAKLAERIKAEIVPHYDEGKYLYWKPLTVVGKTRAKRLGLESLPYLKPSAACPLDVSVPAGVSQEHPLEAAP